MVTDAVANNLRDSFTRFIGRQGEVHELTALVLGDRLVTLTGGAGVAIRLN